MKGTMDSRPGTQKNEGNDGFKTGDTRIKTGNDGNDGFKTGDTRERRERRIQDRGHTGNEGNDGFKTNYANSSQTGRSNGRLNGRSNGRSNYRLNGRSGTIDRPISVMVMTGYDRL